MSRYQIWFVQGRSQYLFRKKHFVFFLDIIHLFLERMEDRKEENERTINVREKHKH